MTKVTAVSLYISMVCVHALLVVGLSSVERCACCHWGCDLSPYPWFLTDTQSLMRLLSLTKLELFHHLYHMNNSSHMVTHFSISMIKKLPTHQRVEEMCARLTACKCFQSLCFISSCKIFKNKEKGKSQCLHYSKRVNFS